MTSNSGDSFDFSTPFTQTVEVEPIKKSETEFAERFESIKNGDSFAAYPQSEPEILREFTKSPPKTSRKTGSLGQWFMTFTLLALLCGVSTFAVINYTENQQKLADSERTRAVAGVKTGSALIVTQVFTLKLQNELSNDFIVTQNKTEFLTGFERGFGKASVIATRNVGTQTQKSGIEVLAQEKSIEVSTDLLVSGLKKNFAVESYSYPKEWNTAVLTKNILTPITTTDPTVTIIETQQQLYIIRGYSQILEYSKLTEELITSLKLN